MTDYSFLYGQASEYLLDLYGWCASCGEPTHQVDVLGGAQGWVHLDTGSQRCYSKHWEYEEGLD